MRRLVDRVLDWLCERIGLRLCFDGNLMAPDGTEPWWSADASAKDVVNEWTV